MRLALFLALTLLAGQALAVELALPDYERVVLDNGTVLLLSQKDEVPLIGMQAVVTAPRNRRDEA